MKVSAVNRMHDSASSHCPLCRGSSGHAYDARDFLHAIPGIFPYHRCTQCGAEFQQPMPSAGQIADYYPSDYVAYAPQARIKRLHALRRAILHQGLGYRHIQVPCGLRAVVRMWGRAGYCAIPDYVAGGRLLDVGCGNGKFLLSMQALGWHCRGVDFSADAVRVCRAAGLDVVQGEIASAGFIAGSFDVITARHLIEHVADPLASLHELARLLNPGGRLYIETPNSAALARARFGIFWFANDAPRHLVLFTAENLCATARQAGLVTVRWYTTASPKVLLNSIDYRLGRRGKPSRHIRWRRLLTAPYVGLARALNRGDTLQAVFGKP